MHSHDEIIGMSKGTGTGLDRYIESFEDRLKARNYTAGTIKTYRVLIRRLAMIMEERCVKSSNPSVPLLLRILLGCKSGAASNS